MKQCIEIICDGGLEYGFGHIRRSYTLAQALSHCGYPIRYSAASMNAEKLLPEFSSSSLQPSLQLLDLPYDINIFLASRHQNAMPIVALDYFGKLETSCVISIYEHITPVPSGVRFAGLKYALIRPEITKRTSTIEGEGVIVMIGGSDVEQIGGTVADSLANKGEQVTLIQGPANKIDYITKSSSVTILKTPSDLEKRMSSCAWAVTNGGTSMMEMMYLGKPAHIIPQTNAEKNLAKIVLNKGGILGIGMKEVRAPSADMGEKVGKIANEIVDGKGVTRIIKIIKGYL